MARHCLSRSNNSLESRSSIQYKDRLYKSASQALEDYIKDYDLSLASPEIKPGKICINQSTPRGLKPSRDCSQQKYALEDFKQRAIKVPVPPPLRRKTTRDPDMLSLTTDDLLAFPPDGSVSFNQVSALRPECQNNKSKRKSQTSALHVRHRISSFGSEGEMSFPGDLVISTPYKDFSRKVSTKHTFHRYHSDASGHSLQNRLTEQEESEPVFYKNYPRWLTSQKSDLSVSEISSLPDFKYPAWLHSHNLLPNSANESFSQASEGGSDFSHLEGSQKRTSVQKLGGSNNFRHSERNGLADLQNKDTVVRNCHHDCRRVCFAPDGLGEDQHSWRENDPKAPLEIKRTPEASADESASILNNGGSPCTVDNLEAERSWDNVPVGLKSPVPVCCEDNSPPSSKASIVNGFLEDCLQNSSQESTFSGGNHHGPVEALKLMLFNLQAFQQSFDLKKTTEQNEESEKASHEDVDSRHWDSDIIPVTRSLQRALHHLSRLKGLVEDTCGKEEKLVARHT